MLRKTLQLTALALLLSSSTAAIAHDEAKGPNGGQVVDTAGHHVEFVPGAGEITFFLSDETGKAIASEGASGKAIVQQEGKTSPIDLTSVAPNKLSAKLPAPLSKGAKVGVTATLADGHGIQARYVVP